MLNAGAEYVALRKESVDRNLVAQIAVEVQNVALRKESVDRNYQRERHKDRAYSRSPQGERG